MVTEKNINLLIKLNVNLIIFACPVIFWQASFDPFGPAQMMAVRILIPFLFLLFGVKSYIAGRLVLKKNPMLLPLALYAAVCAVSVIFAINRQISLKYIFELLLFIFGAYMIYNVTEKKDIARIFVLIMFSHTLMSAYGILQHFDADPFGWNTNFAGRPMGTIGNPDFFAGQLLISIFILAAYTALGSRYRVISAAALAVNLLCLAYTKVLGAYLGFAAGAAVFLLLLAYFKRDELKNQKKAVIIALVVFVAASAAAAPFIYKKAVSFLAEKKRSMVHRLLMWEASLLMVKESPFLGKGFGNYRLYYPKYQGQLLNDPKNVSYDYVVTWMPHQNYLLVAAETGIIGLGLFLLAVFVFYSNCYSIFIRKQITGPAPFGIFAAVTAVLAASFFNTFYNIAATTLYFFMMLFVIYGYAAEPKAQTAGRNEAVITALLSAGILLLFISADARTIVSNILLKIGNKAAKDGKHAAAINYFERILALKPVELCPQTDVAQYYYAAESYRQTGDLKKALLYYKEDLKLNPYCPEVNNMLGALSGQLGDLENSVKYLELSVFVAPHYDAAYINLATAYMAKNDRKNAVRVLEKYLAENGPDERFSGMLRAAGGAENVK